MRLYSRIAIKDDAAYDKLLPDWAMTAVTSVSPLSPSATTPLAGLARALVSAGKLTEAVAEEISRKASASKSSFVAQLVASGHLSAAELAHHIAQIFSTPLLDLDTIDPTRLPKDLLDAKLCASYKVLPLLKRSNRLFVATADPSDKEATEKIKFTAQMGGGLDHCRIRQAGASGGGKFKKRS